MRPGAKLLLTTLLLSTISIWAQERYRSQDPDLLARLSYQSSPMSDPGFQQICITVSRTGDYRMAFWKNGKIGFEGKMTADQLNHLKTLLTANLRSLPGNEAGIIRDHSESFRAEISRIEVPPAFRFKSTPLGPPRSAPGPPHRVQWLNADDQSPFPVGMTRVIDWMKAFEPEEAKPLYDLEFSEVCPSVGLSYVHPSLATNQQP